MRLTATTAIILALAAGAAQARNVETQYNQRNDFRFDAPMQEEAPPPAELAPTADDEALPPVESVQTSPSGIRYVAGGVGETELAFIKSQESQFNVKVLTTMQSGQFVGLYTLRILDAQGGEVFSAMSEGPYVLLQLPAGNYTAEISQEGQMAQSQKFTVGKSRREVRFHVSWQ